MGDKTDDDTLRASRDTPLLGIQRSNAPCFVQIYGEELGKTYLMDHETIVIGRMLGSGIQLNDEYISRQHCRAVKAPDGLMLMDLGSRNGTYINGARVTSAPLRHGDQITCGRTILKLLMGDSIEHNYHEVLHNLATIDSLTGAMIKAHFKKLLNSELKRSIRYSRPLSLLMIDIDHFKKVNDEHGHLVGDGALSKVGGLLSAELRNEDVLCRYGGEEFAVLMPEKRLKQALETAERLRSIIQTADFHCQDVHLSLTVSIGAAELTEAVRDDEQLIKEADDRMYQAKISGRNRVEPAASLRKY